MVFNPLPSYEYRFNIVINNENLHFAKCVKFLGESIDSKLTWNDHISFLNIHKLLWVSE